LYLTLLPRARSQIHASQMSFLGVAESLAFDGSDLSAQTGENSRSSPSLSSGLIVLVEMTTADPRLKQTIDRAWQRLAGLLAALCAALPADWLDTPDGFSPHARRRILRALAPAEALARRLIMTMILQMPPLRAAALISASAPREWPPQSRNGAARAATFSLFEPIASLRACLGRENGTPSPFRAMGSPAILCLDTSAMMENRHDLPARIPGLKTRLRALLTVIADPALTARRFRRRFHRRNAAGRPLRSPLRRVAVPGLASRQTPDWLKEALDVFAFEARGWPPPAPLPEKSV
jgi:hypothetical protein